MIDGASNPEQIPDTIAYALFLAAASEQPNATTDEKARQRALLSTAGLREEEELKQAALILAEHRQRMSTFKAASNSMADEGSRLDALVAVTKISLAARLSPETMTRLAQFIQSEK